jgi:hypothetical protein
VTVRVRMGYSRENLTDSLGIRITFGTNYFKLDNTTKDGNLTFALSISGQVKYYICDF